MITYAASDEGGLHLGDCIVDGDAGSFVEDLHAEDLHAGSCTVLVGTREGNVEGEDLVGVVGQGFFLEAADVIETLTAELVDVGYSLEDDSACSNLLDIPTVYRFILYARDLPGPNQESVYETEPMSPPPSPAPFPLAD